MSAEEKKLTLVSQKNSWTKATSEDLNFDVEAVLRQGKPIKTQEDLRDRIKLLAIHILKFVDNQKVIRKTVAQYFLDIKDAAQKLGYDSEQLRDIAYEIFTEYGISDSYIRKVIPHELKDQSHTNLRYQPGRAEVIEEYESSNLSDDNLPSDTEIQLKNAIERIKDLEVKVRQYEEQLKNSIMIGQETKLFRAPVTLGEKKLPLVVAVDLRKMELQYIEIDTEAIRQQSEAA